LVEHEVFPTLVEVLRIQVHAIINVCDPHHVFKSINVFFKKVGHLFVDEVVLGVLDELVKVRERDIAKLLEHGPFGELVIQFRVKWLRIIKSLRLATSPQFVPEAEFVVFLALGDHWIPKREIGFTQSLLLLLWLFKG